MTTPAIHSRFASVIALAMISLSAAGSAQGEEVRVECRVLHRAADGVYVDIGRPEGLADGIEAVLERPAGPVARVEAAKAGRRSTFLRVAALLGGKLPDAGDEVTLVYEPREVDAWPARTISPTVKDQTSEEEPFVPLLAPLDLGAEAATEAANLVQGRFTLSQTFQVGSRAAADYSATRAFTAGSWERIGGTPWALEWNIDLRYRAGDPFDIAPNLRPGAFWAHRLALFRRFEDRSFVRVGRLLPGELPSAGYFDGIQGEKVLSEDVRLGGIVGFKPTRTYLEVSIDEFAMSPYVTLDLGDDEGLLYRATHGLLFSLYRGTPDRFAWLAEQTLRRGAFDLYSSSEVDLDLGQLAGREGIQLTRWDLLGSYRFAPALTLRAGLDRFQRLGIAAERNDVDPGFLTPEEIFADEFWRYWIGGEHELPLGLRLGEELGYTQSDVGEGFRWNVRLSRTGLPALPDASVTVVVYNLIGERTRGYGGRLSAYVPLLDHRLSLQAGATFRFAEFSTSGETFLFPVQRDFTFTDVWVRGDWRISEAWSVTAGVVWGLADGTNALAVDVGVTFRW